MTDPNEKRPIEPTADPSPAGANGPEKTADSKPDTPRQASELIEADEQKSEESAAGEPNGLEAVKGSVARKAGSLLHTLFQKIESFSHDIVQKTEKAALEEKMVGENPDEKTGEPVRKSGKATTAAKGSSGKTAAKKVATKKKTAAVGKTASKKTAAKKTATKKQAAARKQTTKKAAAKKRPATKKSAPQKPNP